MTKSMTATQARRQFFALLQTAQKPGMTITITHENHPAVIVMSLEEYEGWQETLEVMSDSRLMNDIREAMQEQNSVPLEDLEVGGHAIHRVQSSPQKKGRKTIRKTPPKGPAKSLRRITRSA